MNNKFYNFALWFIIGLFSVMTVGILSIVLVFHSHVDFMCKKDFVLPNIILLLIGLIILSTFSYFIYKNYNKIEAMLGNKIWPVIFFCSVLLVIQIYFCYNYYFLTDWDVSKIIETSYQIAIKKYADIDSAYYSFYPNNIFIVSLYSVIFKIAIGIGASDIASCTMYIIGFQCILSMMTAFLLFKVSVGFSKSYTLSWAVLVFYYIFIGFSSWSVIPYSDATGLIFPILALYIYQLQMNHEFLVVKWVLLGITAFGGFKIKPQILIIFIAMFIVECLKLFSNKSFKNNLLLFVKRLLPFAIVFVLCSVVYNGIVIPLTQISIDQNKEIGFTHFLMMGLNNKTDGVYLTEDVLYTMSFPTVKERQDANIQESKQRIEDYGALGLIKHGVKKCLVNFDDGTFAWGCDGKFFAQMLDDKNNTISPLLKNVYYRDGDYYKITESLQQMMWLTLLVSSIGIVFLIKSPPYRSDLVVAVMSIIGLTMFEMLFEARARYLYTYSPIYIVLGFLGWYCVVWNSTKKKRSRSNNLQR